MTAEDLGPLTELDLRAIATIQQSKELFALSLTLLHTYTQKQSAAINRLLG
jgi:hypothetical protein